uniref:Cyclin_C domain-containing protein n=1 Tax=Heterorhabditis bacteriophora TaxID=37862 RepID=A0A1I7W834_HETBA
MASQRAGDSTKTDRRVVILNILEERHSLNVTDFLLELALLDSSYRNFGGSKVAHASVCLAYAVAKNERAGSERDALIGAERELAVCSRLAVAATRTVMRELVEEMKRASEEMNVVWKEYCSEQMGCVSLFEIPPTLMQLILSNDRV